jgi:hypothetical protein
VSVCDWVSTLARSVAPAASARVSLGRGADLGGSAHTHPSPFSCCFCSCSHSPSFVETPFLAGNRWIATLADHLGWPELAARAAVAERLLLAAPAVDICKAPERPSAPAAGSAAYALLEGAVWHVLPAGARLDAARRGAGGGPGSTPRLAE